MALVNVNRKNLDQFYRYKMPKLLAKVEGKGNGIKTVIVNMVDIAKALQRPPAYPTKYFGCELGAQTQIDLKNERYIVNGSHDAEKLQEILDGFIEKFVLCPDCENPETVLMVDPRKERIGQMCKACGYNGFINMQHRLITFICKNPPNESATTPSKKDKKASRKDKQKGHQNGETSPTHTSTEIQLSESGVENPDFNKKPVAAADDDWSVDTSDEAVQKRMGNLTSGVKGLALSEDSEKPEEERFNLFYSFVKEKKESNTVEKSGKEIVAEADRLDVKDKAVLALSELLFDKDMVGQISKYRAVFLRFVHDNVKAQKYLLGAYELLVGKSFPGDLMPKAAHILKEFYDKDLLEEEVILQWSEKVSKRYVSKNICSQIHAKVAPFVKWLKEAEEEESSEEEGEEEVEVVYDNKAQQLKAQGNSAATADEDEDELDIDAI